MDYTEIQFVLKERVPIIDVFIQEIADLGFDAFQENLNILSSYIPSINYNEKNNFNSLYISIISIFSKKLEYVIVQRW